MHISSNQFSFHQGVLTSDASSRHFVVENIGQIFDDKLFNLQKNIIYDIVVQAGPRGIKYNLFTLL